MWGGGGGHGVSRHTVSGAWIRNISLEDLQRIGNSSKVLAGVWFNADLAAPGLFPELPAACPKIHLESRVLLDTLWADLKTTSGQRLCRSHRLCMSLKLIPMSGCPSSWRNRGMCIYLRSVWTRGA